MRCPVKGCGFPIMSDIHNVPVRRLRGALATHIKYKHPDVWKGSLSRTLNNLSSITGYYYKACDVCGETETIVLTKHHYSRNERSIRRRKKLVNPQWRKWNWRCANCHMVCHRVGVKQFYDEDGYWEKHRIEKESPINNEHNKLVAVYRRGVTTRFKGDKGIV